MFSVSSSFRASNSSFASGSWLKTLTTFWPLIISSTYPFREARDFCCFPKNFALPPPIFIVAFSMKNVPSTITRVSHTLQPSMEMKTTVRVITEETVWGSTWLISWRRVSASLV